MDIPQLIKRLRKAHVKNSLRQIATFCDVNHESIRKLILSGGKSNPTYAVYKKIDSGLTKNGF